MSRGDGWRPEPSAAPTMAQLLRGDCREVLRVMPADQFHAVVCDPPYELGFMGKGWDRSGVAYDPETWRQALRVLRPGGHALVFGGSRTFHRVACALEDAGFEIRDTIMWVYGSGFPKSLDVGKALDKQLGESGRSNDSGPNFKNEVFGRGLGGGQTTAPYEPATDLARRWHGWGTALKPSHEPIIVARKPLDGTVAQNVARWGCGGINVDGCRVPSERATGPAGGAAGGNTWNDSNSGLCKPGEARPVDGRWPANLAHDGSDEVLALFPSEAGAAAPVSGDEPSEASQGRVTGKRARVAGAFHSDAGSAARFFYCAKATRADRDDGCGHLAPTVADQQHSRPRSELDDPRRAGTVPRANSHPTVKPTKLMRWLVRMVCPPGSVVLDPFIGSGSTGRACALEGVDFVGCDLDAEGLYLPIAEARIRACGATVLR